MCHSKEKNSAAKKYGQGAKFSPFRGDLLVRESLNSNHKKTRATKLDTTTTACNRCGEKELCLPVRSQGAFTKHYDSEALD